MNAPDITTRKGGNQMNKNIISLTVLLLVFAVLISACGSSADVPETTGSEIIQPNVCRPLFTISSYDEYLEFLESTDLPDDFVTYDSIAHWGSFRSFVFLSWYDWEGLYPYSTYVYNIIDCNGVNLMIRICHNSDNDSLSAENIITTVNPADMRRLSTDDTGVYDISGIKYRYFYGDLTVIKWNENGVTYSVGITSALCDHPDDFSSRLGQLLNIEGKTGEDLWSLLTGTDTVTE